MELGFRSDVPHQRIRRRERITRCTTCAQIGGPFTSDRSVSGSVLFEMDGCIYNTLYILYPLLKDSMKVPELRSSLTSSNL